MAGFINWEAVLELTMPDMSARPAGMDYFAVQYDGMTKLEKEHTKNQIEVMQLEPTDTVLDVGAGPGRISIPVAKKVKSVTALDGSPKMLEACKRNAEEAGLDNITYLNLPWDDAVVGSTIDKHDVVIASRSPGMRTPAKLNDIARKYVYILTFVGPRLKTIYDELVEGIEETSNPPVSKLGIEHQWVIFNQICDLGIYPSVQYVKDGFTRWYESREAAYEDLRWLTEIPPDKEERYRQNIDKVLSPENGGFRLLRETKTVIIWWKKEG